MTVGVYVGRFSPFHLGHESVIRAMITDVGLEKILIVVGSASEFGTDRNPYSYKERRTFIRSVFSNIKIVPISDVADDDIWFQQLDDLVDSVFPEKLNVVYYSGSIDDSKYYPRDRTVKIIDRNIIPISGTQVRECLRNGQNIGTYVNPNLRLDNAKLTQ